MKNTTLALQIGSRLFQSLAIFWFAVAALVALGLYLFERTDQQYSLQVEQTEALEAGALDLQNEIVNEVLQTRAYLISGEESALTRRDLAHQQVGRYMDQMEQLKAEAGVSELASLPLLADLHSNYDRLADELVVLRQSGRTVEMETMFDAESSPLVEQVQKAGRSLQSEVQLRLQASSRDFTRRTHSVVVGVGVLFVLASALMMVSIYRSLYPRLRSLDLLENEMTAAADTQVYRPVDLPANELEGFRSLAQAYNGLVKRLVESNTAILKYVGTLHHSINSLLASVSGYGQLIADPAMRPDGPSLDEFGQIIVQQTHLVTRLVEDFSLAAKIEGSQFQPPLSPLNLGSLAAAVVDTMRKELQAGGCEAEIELRGPSRPVIVMGDAMSLEVALRKLIDNAVKYSPAGSPVLVSVRAENSPPRAVVEVEDRGIGLSADEIALLFQPFTRIRSDATRLIPGNGMGLYIAASILRAHHGAVSVRSEPGRGSVFALSLPQESVHERR